jgi:hypothetical protein
VRGVSRWREIIGIVRFTGVVLEGVGDREESKKSERKRGPIKN